VGDSPWLPFRLAPNETQLAIHSLPLAFLPEDSSELFACLAKWILNSKDIRILAARFLNPDARSRQNKTATSVLVSVHPGDVQAMGSSIRLFSRSRTVERAYSSNRYTQCKNCWSFGHVAPRCPSSDPVCPICSLNHTRASHRCPNPTCPGGGNLNATAGCCSASPPRCFNCGENHTAVHRDCESRPVPPTLRRSTVAAEEVPPPPVGDEMDTAADVQDHSPPPFTHPLPPVGLRDGYSKGHKDNDTSGLSKAHARHRRPPPRGAASPLSHKQNRLGPGPLMQYNPSSWGGEQVSSPLPKPFTLVQHNCLGSWDVFLSLFGSFTQLAQPPSIVALQDPPVYRGKLPSFRLFSSFSPPTSGGCKPRVACYVYCSFFSTISLLPRFFDRGDVMALDLFTPNGCFNPSTTSFSIINSCSTKERLNNTRSVSPEIVFPLSATRLSP